MMSLRYLILWALSFLWVPSTWAARCPNVGIVLDRSASMTTAPDGSAATAQNPSKWDLAVKAVGDIVTRHDSKFPVGLVYFPSTTSTGLCATSTSFDFPIGYGKKNGILSSLASTKPGGNTPTGDAITNAINDPAFLDAERKQYIILITDGKPCCQPACVDAAVAAFDAVSAVQRARGRLLEIKTFVIGFGRLAPDELQVMNDMADAGGVPAATTGTYHYYRAEDSTALNAALDNIIKTLIGGGGDTGPGTVICDDSCYAYPCPSGHVCVQSACQKNPCEGVSCPTGTYCYTNGTSPGQCVKPCRDACPSGQRCIRGQCEPWTCGGPCQKNQICDSGTCKTDPACMGSLCKSGQGCQGGNCVDDPCSYITCPRNYMCVSMEGTCIPAPGTDPYADELQGGCNCDLRPSRHGEALPLLSSLFLLGVLRRRRAKHA